MRLIQLNYDEATELKDITVNMSYREALALVNIAGALNGIANGKLGLKGEDSLYECLATVFNMHEEEGYQRLNIDLSTLNKD